MSNLSFIKRIDDLGRIVIPKEIRRILKIENNENMKISVNNEDIIIRKHSLLSDKEKNIRTLGEVLEEILKKNIIITNRDQIIYTNIKELENKTISSSLKEYIINRNQIEGFKQIEIVDNYKVKSNFISKVLIVDSDSSGIIIIFDDCINEKDSLLLDIFYRFINKI